jgi:outer membrane protein assembly factor BamB
MRSRRRFLASALAVGAATAGCAGRTGPGSDAPLDPLASTDLAERATATFRGGLRNRGYVEASVPDTVACDWSVPVNRGDHTAAKSTPVPVGGADAGTDDVVIAADTGTLRRLGPDGEERWTATVDPVTRGVHGTPTLANDTAYVGAYDGAVYAFSLADGEREWRTPVGDAIGSSPVYYNGVVYVAVEYDDPSGSVVALDAATGERRWLDDWPTDHPHSTLAIDRVAGRLVVGANDGRLYAWTFPGLERAWTFETGDAVKGPIAVRDGLAVFGSWDGHVYAVDIGTGTERWAFEAGNMVMSAPAVAPDGSVYVGGHDQRLHALSPDGLERWAFDTLGWVIGAVVATPDRVLFGAYDDRVYALERATGREVWHHQGRGHATSGVLLDAGGIYYAERASGDPSAPGHLYRLRAA